MTLLLNMTEDWLLAITGRSCWTRKRSAENSNAFSEFVKKNTLHIYLHSLRLCASGRNIFRGDQQGWRCYAAVL